MLTYAHNAELGIVLEDGRVAVWVKGVKYDAERAARGAAYEVLALLALLVRFTCFARCQV
jgi:hypothetical protein